MVLSSLLPFCQGLTRSETKHVHLLMRWTLMRMLLADLSMSRSINSAEVHLVKTACRQLSYVTSWHVL